MSTDKELEEVSVKVNPRSASLSPDQNMTGGLSTEIAAMFSGQGFNLEPHEPKSPRMQGPVLTASQLLQWNDETARHWKALLAANPAALDFPCDIYGTENVRGLLRHIFAVETRYAQRLGGEPVTPYDQIPVGSIDDLFAIHDAAVTKYRDLLAGKSVDWQEKLEFTTLSAGTLTASRQKILFHSLLHGIRHYAQLATLVRQHGVKPDWAMDFLMSGAIE